MILELGTLGTKVRNDPNLQITLLRGVTEYWKNEQQPEPPHDPHLKQRFSHQKKLGWKQLLYGRFTKKWASEFERLYQRNHHHPSPITGKQWVSQSIRIIWRHVLEMWKTRCEDEHGKTPEEQYTAERTKLLTHVRAIYQQANTIPTDTRQQIMKEQEQDVNKKTNSQIQRWIALVLPIIRIELKHKTWQQKLRTHDIRQYFQTKPPKLKPN
jgi:hypothetical protein